MLFCRGIGRKLSIPVLVFSVLGWVVFVVGFAAFNNTDNYYNGHRENNTDVAKISDRGYFLEVNGSLPGQRASLLWFPHWCVLIVGPVLFICTAIHLIVGRFFTGVFAKFLTAVYLAVGGAVSYSVGVFLFSQTRSGMQYVLQDQVREVPNWLVHQYFGLWHVLEFAGVLSSIFFMALFMMMWPFFSERYEEEEVYDDDEEKQV